ncbi:MAG: Flp pilus assembly protein CpaB [Hyphomonadaceae bacterium]
MSPVRLIILLVAAGAAVAAVFFVRSMQQPAPAEAAAVVVEQKPIALKQVLVAKVDVPLGKYVTPDDLTWLDWPEQADTAAFIVHEDAPAALEEYVGAVAVSRLTAGEPITKNKLKHAGGKGFMSVMLTPGMQAVSIEINSTSAAAGFIQPGDHVDLMLTRKVSKDDGEAGMIGSASSRRILANVRVLAIDGVYEPAKGERAATLVGSRATLELEPYDAELVYAAQEAGDLQITLRSIDDLRGHSGATAVGRSMRGGDQQPVQIYRYGKPSVARVPAE